MTELLTKMRFIIQPTQNRFTKSFLLFSVSAVRVSAIFQNTEDKDINKTFILKYMLCSCKMWSRTLCGDYKPHLFENKEDG
jgi:hypothetical protein